MQKVDCKIVGIFEWWGKREIDAFGVRGIGSVMTARERSVATLASLAFRTHDCVARS